MVTMDNRKLSKYLWSTLVMATIVGCGCFVFISLFSGEKQVSSNPSPNNIPPSPGMLSAEECISVCDSKECVYQSKYLNEMMDTGVDPCENFFQFACGRVYEKYGEEKAFSYSEIYTDILHLKLKIILDNLEADPSTASGKLKTVYDSCIKHSTSDLRAVPTILDFLHNGGIPGWPNLPPDFQFINPSIGRVLANLSSYEEYSFVEFSTQSEFMYNAPPGMKHNLTVLDPTSPYEKYKTPDRKYLVERSLKYLNLDPGSIGKMWEESEAIHDAIINLREASLEMQDNHEDLSLDCRKDTRNKWEDICEYLESLIDITAAKEKVSENFANIRGRSEHFMLNIFPILRNFSDRSLANYLALNTLFNNMNELDFYFRLSKGEVTLNDVSSLKWRKCVQWIVKNMPFAMGREYVKADFTVPLIRDVQNLVREAIRATVDLISRQKWINERGKRFLVLEVLGVKLNLKSMIEVLSNEAKINLYYEQFHPTDENFLLSVLDYKKCFRKLNLHDLITDEDRLLADNTLPVHIQYGNNEILAGLGLLMPPTYTPRLQRFMNLVALSSLVVHEVGHYLEDLSTSDQISESDHYKNRTKCLVDQYSQFWIETIQKNVNGSKQFRENFADTIAVSVIDKLVEKYASDGSSALMPSLPFSLKQLMYINAAQIWCGIHTKDMDEMNYNDTHTADRFRLLGMTQNSKGFSGAFGCTEGSYMNPINKCTFI